MHFGCTRIDTETHIHLQLETACAHNFIDVEAHAGYHLIFCASKYLHGKCICRLIFTRPLDKAFTHTLIQNEVLTQIRTFLCRSVVVVVYHKLYWKESLWTIYRSKYLWSKMKLQRVQTLQLFFIVYFLPLFYGKTTFSISVPFTIIVTRMI